MRTVAVVFGLLKAAKKPHVEIQAVVAGSFYEELWQGASRFGLNSLQSSVYEAPRGSVALIA